MTTLANMLSSQIAEPSDLRASTPAVYRFELDVVSLGTTKRGKPPRVRVSYNLLLFMVALVGFLVMLHGLSLEAESTKVAVTAMHRL